MGVETCDYCDNVEHITTLVDRTEKEGDVHICQDCYVSGVELMPKITDEVQL